MSIDYSLLKFAKARPALLDREDKRTAKATAEKRAKADVMARDKKLCRICGRVATEVHEALAFKSKGLAGLPSLQNSLALCAKPRGLCHQLMQAHVVRPVGKHCSNGIIFEMSAEIAARIFGRKPRPAHVRVVG